MSIIQCTYDDNCHRNLEYIYKHVLPLISSHMVVCPTYNPSGKFKEVYKQGREMMFLWVI